MTPQQYLAIEREQQKIIDEAEDVIAKARRKADKCPKPKNLRKANADDIKVGAVIWLDADDGFVWNVVEELRHYGDDWKAYVADDGCRYGLHSAYVESNHTIGHTEK